MPKATLGFTLDNTDTRLSSRYKKTASRELNKVATQVPAHLESIKRWLQSMPHLKCPTDDEFLLAFLRQAKFNHAKAQNRLDNFCTFRTSESEGYPPWFSTNTRDSIGWERFLNLRHFVPLGFTSEGCLCSIMRGDHWDFDKVSFPEMMKTMQIWIDHTMRDRRVQISGTVFIFDANNMSREQLSKMTDLLKILRVNTKYYQEALPFRIKKMIYFNMPKFCEVVYRVMAEWFNEKIKSKTMVLSGSLKQAFDEIEGLQDLLPVEYGGTNTSFEEILDFTMPVLVDLVNATPNIDVAVNESKRPKNSRNLMHEYKNPASTGLEGTYIKFDEEI